jgi:hypothetical protein
MLPLVKEIPFDFFIGVLVGDPARGVGRVEVAS